MSELHKDLYLYSASCNPPRRAKRPPIVEPSLSSDTMTPAVDSIIEDVSTPLATATAPAKRGRKPGPLSRSAREAQRRLNHSIIEKARRTKINDTLATLRQLVPVDYGTSPQSQHEDEEDEEAEEDDYPEGAKRLSKPKPKTTGKREEKEKEFKLEILVRTVSYLQDLLKRVDTMENTLSVCQHCGASQSCKKRKHDDDDDDEQPSKPPKVTRNAEEHPRQVLKPHTHSDSIPNPYSNPIPTSHSSPVPNMGSPSGARLPSISSWLPDATIDQTLPLPQSKPKASPNLFSYPSPPSSTHFDPIRTSQVPPVLNLGPVATAAMVVALPPHTSEDESAASLLLQIAKSPPSRPSIPSPTSSSSTSSSTISTISNYNLANPSKISLHSDVRNQRMSSSRHVSSRQPETPRSLLGLHRERKY